MQQQKRIYRLWGMLLLFVLVLSVPILAAYPTHTDYISDVDNVLSDTTISAIKTTNNTLYTNRGVQIGVCITAGTGDETITEFSRALFTKWEMCDGVLLVLDTTNQTYFAVQSVDIDDIITNAVLSDIFDNNMEEDFAAGNIDRAVMKTVTALSQTMTNTLPDPNATDETPTVEGETDPAEEEKPSGFVTFMKVILWIILLAVVAAVAIFVVALFNDDVADFLRTYVFRRGPVTGYNRTPHPGYYDDRLYGNGQRNQQPNGNRNGGYNGQRRPQGQYPQNRNYSQNPQYRQNPNNRGSYDPYNDYDAQYNVPQYQSQGQRSPGQRSQNGQRNNQYRNNGQYNGRNY